MIDTASLPSGEKMRETARPSMSPMAWSLPLFAGLMIASARNSSVMMPKSRPWAFLLHDVEGHVAQDRDGIEPVAALIVEADHAQAVLDGDEPICEPMNARRHGIRHAPYDDLRELTVGKDGSDPCDDRHGSHEAIMNRWRVGIITQQGRSPSGCRRSSA